MKQFKVLRNYVKKDEEKSYEWIIQTQAFLRLYDSAPRLPPSPPLRDKVASLSQSSRVLQVEITDGRGWEGAGEDPN